MLPRRQVDAVGVVQAAREIADGDDLCARYALRRRARSATKIIAISDFTAACNNANGVDLLAVSITSKKQIARRVPAAGDKIATTSCCSSSARARAAALERQITGKKCRQNPMSHPRRGR